MSVGRSGVTNCAVLGSPIAHSLSPALHMAAYAYLGFNWHYGRHEISTADLPGFLDRLDSSWRGLSLTRPLKEAAIACVDEVSGTARAVDAVNTIVIEPGARRGDNTDVPGMLAGLRERGVVRAASGSVLGGGATARSALAALHEIADTAVVYTRTASRAGHLLATAGALGLACTVRPWAERRDGLADPIVMITTPAGATDDLAETLPEAPGVLLDVGYGPGPTVMATSWAAAGGAVVDGLDLLVHQAVLQVQLMTGQSVPIGILRTAAHEH